MSPNTYWVLLQLAAAGLMYALGHREEEKGRRGWAWWFYFFCIWNVLGAAVDLAVPPAA